MWRLISEVAGQNCSSSVEHYANSMTFQLWTVEHCAIMMVVAVELFQLFCIVWVQSPLLDS